MHSLLKAGMRRRLVFSLLVLASALMTSAQSTLPDTDFEQGSVIDHVYVNHALRITWELPKDWTVQSEGGSMLGENYHVLLRVLPSGIQSQDFIEFNYSRSADPIGEGTVLQNKGWEPLGNPGYYTLGGGIPTHRSDYKSKSEPTRYLTLLDGQHYGSVTLILNADSPARIEEFGKSAGQMKVQTDWGSPEAATPMSPGSQPLRVRVSQGVNQGLLERKVQPPYPDAPRKAHIQGAVVMLAHVSTKGKIKNLFVLSGHPLLNPTALEAVSQWLYRPYLLNGKPVEVETQITVIFSLH